MSVKNKKVPNGGVIERTWEYSSNMRLEGLLQASKYLHWKNVESFEKLDTKNRNRDN